MADFGIQKGHLKSLKQKFEKLQPPPKPPKPKHLSRPASMISIQNRISFYEENPFLDVPLIHSKSKSDSAVNVEFPEIPFIEVEPVASVQSPDVPVKRVMQRNEQVTIQADQQKVITTPNVLDEKQQKRALVVQEIRDTEKSYLQDLIVLKQVYVEPGYEIFPLETIKLLFGNLDQVIQVSNELTSMLDQYPDFIGDCFLQLMKRIETTYATYCKFNEASLQKIQEYSLPTAPQNIKLYLEQSKVKMQGRTNAWDLASMVVKPVQRVLKYPLLIKRLLKETENTHADYESLKKADEELELVAELINEVKKRKDIVEKYVQGKGNVNVIHGLSKKLNRGKQILKKSTGISEEVNDELYDAIIEKFEFMNTSIPNIEKSIQAWIKAVKEHLDGDVLFGTILEEFYGADRSLALLKKYRQGRERVLAGPFTNIQRELKQVIYPSLQTLNNQFKTPMIVIRKRQAKVLDYERYRELLLKNAEIEVSLKESAEAYESINAQLCEEIPIFLHFCLEYLHIVLGDFIQLQQAFYDETRISLVELYEQMAMDPMSTTDEITQKYIFDMEMGNLAEISSRDIKILHKWRESIWGSGHYETHHTNHNEHNELQNGLINVHGGIGAPRLVHSQSDTDSILRQKVSLQVMKPTLPDFDYEVKALYPFQAEFEDELDLVAGDIVLVVTNEERHGSDEWKFGTSERGQGWFPQNYTERI